MSGEIIFRLNQITKNLSADALADEGHKYFRKITPIRSGNARRNTVLSKDTIEANYPYARRLDQGYSRQAPDGMTKPTEEYMKEWIRKQSKG